MLADLYIHKDSIIHNTSIIYKFFFCFLFFSTLFFLSGLITQFSVFTFILFLYKLSKLSFNIIYGIFTKYFEISLIIFINNVLINDWYHAANISIRIHNFILLSSLFTYTSRASDIIFELEYFLNKKKFLTFDTKKFSLAIGLVLFFIPTIEKIYDEVKLAQRARGLEKNYFALIIPLIARIIKFGDEVSESLETKLK